MPEQAFSAWRMGHASANLPTFRRQAVKLSVVMPVYNEEKTLREIVRKVMSVDAGIEKELLMVDDCSADGSLQIMRQIAAEDPRCRALGH
ncbi:MAG: glycosyltransferase, partial [Lentisphaerae bacterium]|nr:glycosyltransferase [Lentisphaerota bacterium]